MLATHFGAALGVHAFPRRNNTSHRGSHGRPQARSPSKPKAEAAGHVVLLHRHLDALQGQLQGPVNLTHFFASDRANGNQGKHHCTESTMAGDLRLGHKKGCPFSSPFVLMPSHFPWDSFPGCISVIERLLFLFPCCGFARYGPFKNVNVIWGGKI